MSDFPTEPGSLIRATAAARLAPSLFMRAKVSSDRTPVWVHVAGGRYSQSELTLVEVIHDEGRAKLLANLPAWDELTDVDKGCALAYAWKVDNEGHEYAVENYPAKFLDHPVLTRLTPREACGYVDFLGFDLGLDDAIRFVNDREDPESEDPREMSWSEVHRLYDLALDAERDRRAGGAA